jgi:thiol-disulfide isomerase/thioredoxin
MRVVLSVLLFSFASFAQSDFPACEPRPEVRQALHDKLNPVDLDKLKFPERVTRTHQVLDDLIARYPRELEPYDRLISFVRGKEPDAFPALQARFRDQAAKQPEDPLALYLAAVVQIGTNTPEAIRLLETARSKAPHFAAPMAQLSRIYSSGKFAAPAKAAAYLGDFFIACPTATDTMSMYYLRKSGDISLTARTAAALRTYLATETDLEVLRKYETLWGLEFRVHPPQDHAGLRKQVAEDGKRLEAINPKPDAEWLYFLRGGLKQSGADDAARAAFDDRLLKEFPRSAQASRVAYDRWREQHKEPEDQKDAAAWAAYDQAYRAALKGWIRDFTEDTYLARGKMWFYTVSDDRTLSEKDGLATVDQFLKTTTDYDAPVSSHLIDAAEFLVIRKWQPRRALELLHRAQPMLAKEQARNVYDNLDADRQDEEDRSTLYDRQNLAALILLAARQAGRPADAQAVRAEVESAPPKWPKRLSAYWANRARLAALENRKADALAYYQLALQTRTAPPNFWHGNLTDDLADEARAMWKELNGSDAAWSLWRQPAGPTKPQEAAEGRWEKPTKTLPTFELTDLSGKTWKLATLEGKSVLINLWATWCGPCQGELQHLQKLYDTVKDRPGLQILTLNLDENVGLVEPYMKAKGYTFPVLPAFSYVTKLLDGFAIPQIWILDPKGAWRWTQIGFGGEPDWEGVMIQKMESVKKGE